MARGIVEGFNRQIGRIALRADGGYVIADTDEGDFEIGDEISGTLEDHGDQTWKNLRSGQRFTVCVEAYYGSRESAAELLSGGR